MESRKRDISVVLSVLAVLALALWALARWLRPNPAAILGALAIELAGPVLLTALSGRGAVPDLEGDPNHAAMKAAPLAHLHAATAGLWLGMVSSDPVAATGLFLLLFVVIGGVLGGTLSIAWRRFLTFVFVVVVAVGVGAWLRALLL